jgi:hypothetical protein
MIMVTGIHRQSIHRLIGDRLSRILPRSCPFPRISFHGSLYFLRILGTVNIVKSEGKILSRSFHLTGIDIVAETDGLVEKTEAIVFPLAF